MTHRTSRLLLALLLLAAMAGCVRMPTSGPVEVRTGTGRAQETPRVYFNPPGPQAGESPSEIVTHFLEAMTATPIDISVARQFLSADAHQTWQPEAIITYAEAGEASGDLEVLQPLTGINHYDDRGAWQSRAGARELRFPMTKEDGEWRIDSAPDALIVPEGWFADSYQRVSLHFFDPTADILVPEPVYVPVGDQSGAAMVRGLLADPSDGPQVARTFFPPGLTLGLSSVPITPGGIAEVMLSGGDPEALDEATTQRLLAQLVWTLRQEPRVSAVQVSVGDRELGLPGGPTQVRLDVGAAYDPTGAQATGDLFGLLGGRLVRGSADGFEPTAGPLGSTPLGVRSVGVDLAGEQAAAVASDGRRAWVAPVDDPDGSAVRVAEGARDLLPPHWDFAGRLWLLDRGRFGAQVLFVAGPRLRRAAVDVPGITGQDVRHFLVSRDGSRLVAVVRTRTGDRVRVSRILHDERGRVLRATRARDIAPTLAAGRISDLGWRSPIAVSLLLNDLPNDELSQVRTVSVEGAPEEVLTPTRLRGRTSRLVTSPVEGAGVYAVSGSSITDMASPDQELSALPAGLEFLTYVG